MNANILRVGMVVLAAGMFSLASAQTAPAPQQNPNGASALRYVEEPTASVVKKQGPEAEAEATLVQALNADASLKGSKITVAVEKDMVTLTGVTATKQQRQKVIEIATTQMGEGKVINAIYPAEV